MQNVTRLANSGKAGHSYFGRVDPDPCSIIIINGRGGRGGVFYAKIGSFRVLGKIWFRYVSGSKYGFGRRQLPVCEKSGKK